MNAALEPELPKARVAQRRTPMSEPTPPRETGSKLRRRTGPQPGTAFATEWTLELTAGTAGTSPDAPAVVAVGGSSDRHPHVAGSVSSNSARVDPSPRVV